VDPTTGQETTDSQAFTLRTEQSQEVICKKIVSSDRLEGLKGVIFHVAISASRE